MEQVFPNAIGGTTSEGTKHDRATISLRKGAAPDYLTKDSVINGVPVDIHDFAYVSEKGVYIVPKTPKDGVLDKYHFKDKEMYDTYAGLVLQVAFS